MKKSGFKGLGKRPSKTSKKTKKMLPIVQGGFFNHVPPSNTPGSNEPGPGPTS